MAMKSSLFAVVLVVAARGCVDGLSVPLEEARVALALALASGQEGSFTSFGPSSEIKADSQCLEATWQRIKAACLPVLPDSVASLSKYWNPLTETVEPQDAEEGHVNVAWDYWKPERTFVLSGQLSKSREKGEDGSGADGSFDWNEWTADQGKGGPTGGGTEATSTVAAWQEYIGVRRRVYYSLVEQVLPAGSLAADAVLDFSVNQCFGEVCYIEGSVVGPRLPLLPDKASPLAGSASGGSQAEGQEGSPLVEVQGLLLKSRMHNGTLGAKEYPFLELRYAKMCVVATGDVTAAPEKTIRVLLNVRPDTTDLRSLAAPHKRSTRWLAAGLVQPITMPGGGLACCHRTSSASQPCTDGDSSMLGRVGAGAATLDEAAAESWVHFSGIDRELLGRYRSDEEAGEEAL